MMLKDKSIDFLKVVNNKVKYGKDFKKLPASLFSCTLDLFIYHAELGLECLVYIYIDPSTKQYIFTVPKQLVSYTAIKVEQNINYYELNLLTKSIVMPYIGKLVRVGSIHSHHSMSPKFSIEDNISDYNGPPGLHILMGSYPDMKFTCCFVVNSKRHYIEPNKVIDYTNKHIYQYRNTVGLHKAITILKERE